FVNPLTLGAILSTTATGHYVFQGTWSDLSSLAVTPSPLAAWRGEPAGTRFARLCSEENITFRGQGQLSATLPVGTQLSATPLSLPQACASAGRGLMTEPRQQFALAYRTRSSLYSQPAAVSLSYSPVAGAGQISALEPVDDDQNLTNDVTVSLV